MNALDAHEGVHARQPAYMRKNVQVLVGDGQSVAAITYEVVNKATNLYAPSAEYLRLIAAGAGKWGLPQQYQDMLSEIQTQS